MCNSVLSRKWPRAAGIKPLYRAISGLEREGSYCCSPLLRNTLSLLNQSRISTAAHTSQHIQQMEEKEEEEKKKPFKSSVACWAREAGSDTRRGVCVLMRHLPCQLKANSGLGISKPPPWAHRYWWVRGCRGWYGRTDHGVGILWNVTSTLLFIHGVYRLCSR